MLTHQILLLLFIGYVVYTIDLKQKYFPVPVILVMIGIFLSFVPFFSSLIITKEIIFNVFLPAILFTSAYQFSWEKLKKNKVIIAVLSTIGLMATVFLLGWVIYALSGPFVSITLTGAFLLAAILTPTDPVSVVSILKQSSGDEEVAGLIEGESMLNDGTSVVIFSVVLSMFQTGNSFSISTFITEFLLVSIGGISLGLLLGWLMSRAVHLTHHRKYQVMLSIIIAYGGFYLGEAIGVSGVLTTVIAGIMLSYEFGHTIKESHFRDSLDGFWNIMESSIFTFIFLLIGIQSAEYLIFPGWGLAIAIFVLTILIRFIVLGGLLIILPTWREKVADKFSTVTLITWSGIKGTMSVALLLWLETSISSGDNLLVPLAFAVILLSLLFQSVGIYPLTQLLSNRSRQ